MKRIMTAGVCLILAAGMLTGCGESTGQTEVTTSMAKAGEDLSSMAWQGTVEALSTIDVMPPGSGKVVSIPAAEGQHVKEGDVIFQVDDRDAALSLAQAKAGYDAAAAAFNSAEKASGQNTGVMPAQIAYTDAQNNFNRIQELYNANVVSQSDYEKAKSQMDAAASKLQAARNGQDGNYDAAKAQRDSAKAALDIAQKRFDDCSVASPITGMIAKINVEVGQTVSPQTPGATVIDDSGEKVEIQVADTDISQLKTGMPMTVGLQSAGTVCGASISEISAVCDSKTGMYTVKVLLDQKEDGGPCNGLMADVRAAGSEAKGSVYIPAKCIQSDDGGTYVYTVSDGTAVKTPVVQGKKKNAYMEITDGLSQGSEVVFQSSRALLDGMKVRVLTNME